ncbi:MAG: NUDIX domain-containing protein [Bacteroidales bacterium]|jgi:ADP-ribose pyrophosphatase YjhB (NUDIX family)|nr:NUDIX domain-containing protein [Bacteroidales bacterium]
MDVLNFTIRVYGLLIKDGAVLISDEFQMGTRMSKFPGGGMEPGEGTLECLKRECMEEMGQDVIVGRHFYTTDYFQPTMLVKPRAQLVSIYYLMELAMEPVFEISENAFEYGEDREGAQSFRWLKLQKELVDQISFPIDKGVFMSLCNEGIRNS